MHRTGKLAASGSWLRRLARSHTTRTGTLRGAARRMLDDGNDNATSAAGPAAAKISRLNAALQGGGAHGAFTWGVLDRLLEDGRVDFASVSGTSAGAMNAVILASGMMDGGATGARAKLEAFWLAVSSTARTYNPGRPHPLDPRPAPDSTTGLMMLDLLTRMVSPYQFNPLDFNPLREVLLGTVDFKRLRRSSPIALHIAATEVASGKVRIFETREISVEAVLASACLPQLHQAVKIGRNHYWDGGYSANPPLLPLLRAGRAEDTLIVQIDPTTDRELPTSAQAIIARLNRMAFNGPLRREVELIVHIRHVASEGFAIGGTLRRRVKGHRFHHIAAGDLSRDLGGASRLNPDMKLLYRLRDRGRAAADIWLKRHYQAVGRESTVDLAAQFL